MRDVWTFFIIVVVSFLIMTITGIGIWIGLPLLGLFGAMSLAPCFIFSWRFFWKEHRNKVKLKDISHMFFIGMASVLGILICEYSLSISLHYILTVAFGSETNARSSLGGILLIASIQAFIIASFCEEGAKYFLVWYASFAHEDAAEPPHDAPYTFALYGIACALGLATVENLGFMVVVSMKQNYFLLIFAFFARSLLSVPIHTFTGALIGCEIGLNHFGFQQKRFHQIIRMPLVLHGAFDFFLMFPPLFVAHYNHPWAEWTFLLSLISIFITAWAGRLANKKLRYLVVQESMHRVSEV
eukprot:TRINITY_DN13098_c0_g1_i1.p1 TRINITY_DN13098_c0_g1~~TRINITY_DN13098_c0_g1_i1.p1  ORF type:complete len:299 (-),score=47.80 TRINITY_DN13098_c0_g1_i1:211-1107(-)